MLGRRVRGRDALVIGALGNYLCEGEDPCPHEIREFHADCGWED